jgi:hypothetical protein
VRIGRSLALLAQADVLVASAIRLEYEILHFGLRLFDETVVSHLPDQSSHRALYRQLLLGLDTAAARHLHDPAAARRIAERAVLSEAAPQTGDRPDLSEFERALIRRRAGEAYAMARRVQLFGVPPTHNTSKDPPHELAEVARIPRADPLSIDPEVT